MFSSKDLFFTTPAGGYQIAKSLRFRRSASAYLSRTPGTAGNRKTFTLSAWIKRGLLSAEQGVFYRVSPTGTDTDSFAVTLLAADTLSISGYATNYRITTQVFRDTSAWYHIVVAVDTTQATANNRIRVYVNGAEVTAFGTTNNPTQNADTGVNSTAQHSIGSEQPYTSSREFDGYMADVYLIDGQQLTASSFGETDATTGVWKPKAYTGTYGTNGFYLKFTDVGSTTAGGGNSGYGKDFSGNSNYWATNNLNSTSTSTSYDSMIDTPTPYDNGGTGVGNYATLNPLAVVTGSTPTLSNGNLTTVTGVAGAGYSMATIALPSSGKYYWETGASSTAGGMLNGIAPYSTTMNAFTGTACSYYSDGTKYVNGVNSAYGSAYTTNTIGIAVDIDSGTVTFYRDNVSQGAITYAGANLFAFVSDGSSSNSSTFDVNFGQRPFTYTPPSGFKALNTQNLPTPTIAAGDDYFNVILYTGTGASNARTGVGFQPDLVWIKERNAAADHGLYDAVRGVQKQLESNTTTAETTETTGLTAFGTDGFTVGALAQLNTNNDTYVAWNWKANGSGSSNTSGSITSTVSANTTAGFSVVTYTGTLTGTPGTCPTVGHGLGVAPSLVISKSQNVTGVDSGAWFVWSANTGSTDNYLRLNTTAAVASVTGGGGGPMVAPTSTVFSTPYISGANINANNYVAYCFAAVAGYSAFGSYTGNGSADGPFVFTGFRPRFVLIKRTDSTGNWLIWDTTRNTYNLTDLPLYPNLSNSEASEPTRAIDILSNGFKLRSTGTDVNASSGNYIIYAAAENPFKYALAR
jgi:hypothetical protein